MLNDIIIGVGVVAVVTLLGYLAIWGVLDLRAHDPKNKNHPNQLSNGCKLTLGHGG